MTMPNFCLYDVGLELMRQARQDISDTTPRLILADWLESLSIDSAIEMSCALRKSFECEGLVRLSAESSARLFPMVGARQGWFSGPWSGNGGEIERLWLASPMSVRLQGDVWLELELIPAGIFMMGSPESEAERSDDETQHQVTISKPYYLGKYPVTQAQWQQVMGNNPSHFKGDKLRPVEKVSWDDAQAFCRKLKEITQAPFGIPTESQWEYACRAGTNTPFHFGSELNGRQANCHGTRPYGTDSEGPYLEKTTMVGKYQANAWGLYDMHGNVWEWCSDWYGDYPTGSVTDPIGPATGSIRVLRGGSWYRDAVDCRSAYRSGSDPSFRRYLGFRVALSSSGIPK